MKVEVGKWYINRDDNNRAFLKNDPFFIGKLLKNKNGDRYEYTYLSDNWVTSRSVDSFVKIHSLTKLEKIILGIEDTDVKMAKEHD